MASGSPSSGRASAVSSADTVHPAKVAVCLGGDAAAAASVVHRMLRAQRLREHHNPQVVSVDAGAIGWLATSPPATDVRLGRHGSSGNLLLVTGVPVSLEKPLDGVLASVADGDHQHAAQVLPTLDGAFAAVHWDAASRKVVVVTDFLGMQPLYEVDAKGVLMLATELKGAAAGGRVSMDPRGWGWLAALGHFAEDATSLAGVRRVPESTVLVYDTASGTRDESRYWRWPDSRPGLTLAGVDTAGVLDALRRHALAYRVHRADATMLLSGGFDSRLIAATLAAEGVRPRALVLSHADEQDDADGRLALRVARALGLDCTRVAPAPGFYSSAAYVDYLLMNEVATTSFGLFIAQIASSLAGQAQAVWEGVAPNYTLRTPHQQGGGFEPFFRTQTEAFDTTLWQACGRCSPRRSPTRWRPRSGSACAVRARTTRMISSASPSSSRAAACAIAPARTPSRCTQTTTCPSPPASPRSSGSSPRASRSTSRLTAASRWRSSGATFQTSPASPSARRERSTQAAAAAISASRFSGFARS